MRNDGTDTRRCGWRLCLTELEKSGKLNLKARARPRSLYDETHQRVIWETLERGFLGRAPSLWLNFRNLLAAESRTGDHDFMNTTTRQIRILLKAAMETHRSGQHEAAAELYARVLSHDENNAEALHWLGLLHHQAGDHVTAAQLIGRAVEIRPSAYLYHSNLAEVYRALGEFARAAASCREALRLWPDYPEAHCNLGAALLDMGCHDEAVGPLRRALALRPDFAVAHNNLGIVLRELKKADEALEHFRRAAELEPTFAAARTNLGQMLVNRGLADQALAHCQEAVRLEQDRAELHDNLGNVYRALDRLDEAWTAYTAAIRLNPDLPLANAHIGLVLQKQGHFPDAVPWLTRAVELQPANGVLWEWLAELYGELDEPAASIPCWEQVVALEPERASAHIALGRALQDEGRLIDARVHYLKADELQPHASNPQVNLGWLHELQGEMDLAEEAFRRALERQPKLPAPHARLASLLRGKLPDIDLAALEDRLADSAISDRPRSHLLFGLAHVLDGRGDYAGAALCLAQANALALKHESVRHQYSPKDHERYVDGLIEVFGGGLFTNLAGAGLNSRRPIFIFGLPRSGTTLVEQVLASHSRIHGAGELRLARRSFDEIPHRLGLNLPPRECIPLLDAAMVRRLAEIHLDRLAVIDGGGTERIVDKMPENYLYLGLLAVLFPEAVFIHCRRDLRDVAVSCWMTDFTSIRWANEPAHIATRFQEYRRLMDYWSVALPVRIHPVDYEHTVANLESVARRLVEACSLEWEPACLDFHQTQRPVRTASVTQVRQPVYTQSVGRWKNYEPALATLFAALPTDDKGPPPRDD
jgi:tetratricopeptide (TPR) repeat protein